MIKKLFPVLLAIIGLGAGVGVGKMLQPPPEVVEVNPCGDMGDQTQTASVPEEDPMGAEQQGKEYVKLNNQFVIPDVEEDRVAAMVVLSLSLEVTTGAREAVYLKEPKLRDAFLQVLFDHANSGGFRGAFTSSKNMTNLRTSLREVAQRVIGDQVSDVLIIDIVRQDVT